MAMETPDSQQQLVIARIVQEACVHTAKEAFENAGVSGLCGEGALEAAISAIEMLDLEFLLAERLAR